MTVALVGSVTAGLSPAAASPPAVTAKGPVGWGVYRNLNDLSLLTEGVETEQDSSFDRTGGNNDFDHCLKSTPTEGCVLAQHDGPGEIDSIWQTDTGGEAERAGNLHIVLDGKTVVDAPWEAIVQGKLGAPFVYPLVYDSTQTPEANLIVVPMPFRSSMLVYSDHDPDYFHVTYRTFANAAGVATFNPSDKALDVIAELKAAGTTDPKPPQPGAVRQTHDFTVAPHGSATLATARGPGEITALRLHLPPRAETDQVLRRARLEISFDGRLLVNSPLGEFFGSSLGDYPVKSLMFAMDPTTGWLSAWWPMPYRQRATVRLVDDSDVAIGPGQAQVTTAPEPAFATALLPGGDVGYFRTTSHAGATSPGVDWQWIQATGRGKFVGVTQGMQGATQGYLEGDERAYVDGARTPQIAGTGTEDYFEGGYYFNGTAFSNPLQGSPAHQVKTDGCRENCTEAYRLMLADAVPFGSSLSFGIEHGGVDDVPADYSSTAYWYSQPRPDLRWTDTLQVGSRSSDAAHDYSSADPGTATTLTATFEGDDGTPHPTTGTVRDTTAPVTFRLRVAPGNDGVILRRTSDQDHAYQEAAVAVDGRPVGTWLEPLGNSHHRWLDDYFQLPASATAGRRRIDVTLTPVAGAPAWSAASYQAISVVRPFADRQPPTVVTGLRGRAAYDTVSLRWATSTDSVYAPRYQVYASTDPTFEVSARTLVGTAALPAFTVTDLGLHRTWYFRVRAVDAAGNEGPASTAVSARTGGTLHFEAESLLPPAASTGSVAAQASCCGVTWSGGAQLSLSGTTAGDSVTLDFRAPSAGTYSLAVVETKAPFYGISTLRVDGKPVGAPFDGFHTPGLEVTPPMEEGTVRLRAGENSLILQVTGKNPAAASYAYSAGIDYFDLRLVR